MTCVAAALACLLLARAPRADGQDLSASDEMEAYLASRGLDELLSTYLLDRLRAAPGSERARFADRLGAHYAALLGRSLPPERQREIEALSRELLELVPDSESFDLRITLFKASFLRAEELARRRLSGLDTPADASEAERTLREVGPKFEDIGRRIDHRVEALEEMEDRAGEGDIRLIRDQLADARRQRSLAMYYAGWSATYLALVTGEEAAGERALKHFGWLLNSPGNRPASPERLAPAMLRYEHVCRAAMGCALASSLRGDDAAALRWLDAVENSAESPAPTRGEIPAQRIHILGRAKRWADLRRLVDRRRAEGAPLPVGEARLVAVVTLGALTEGAGATDRDRLLEAMAQIAMGDLVAAGEVGHVLDLVKRFGTTPIAGDTFVVQYVRALRAYERAREAHAQGGSADDPATDPAMVNRYRDAARSFRVAREASDAAKFPKESANAGVREGLALYFAGDFEEAADAFERALADVVESAQREEATWYAIVALDRGVEQGKTILAERRDRLAALYLETYPGSERAATLLLRRVEQGLLRDEQAVEVLCAVPPDSALYLTARRHASRLLYKLYRSARGPGRDFAAGRFVEVAQDLIRRDVESLRVGTPNPETAGATLVRVRQVLDAQLGVAAPDVPGARQTLALLDDLVQLNGVDLADAAGELAYRRLQIALAAADDAGVETALAALQRAGGPFVLSGDRLLYRRALERWRASPDDTDAAGRLVAAGWRVLTPLEPLEPRAQDTVVAGVMEAVSDAASRVWLASGETAMRDMSLSLDTRLIAMGRQTAPLLRRLARSAEGKGDFETASGCWRTLSNGLREGVDGWFEARTELVRVLTLTDRPRARAVLDQHIVLFPSFGPEPWGTRLRELDASLRGVTPMPLEGGEG